MGRVAHPRAEVDALGDVAGRDVLEYGCGAAQWSAALAADGAPSSPSTSRVASCATPRRPPPQARGSCARAARPSPSRMAVSTWCSATTARCRSAIPIARCPRSRACCARAGGFAFSHSTPWPYLAWDERRERVGRRLRRPYFGIRRFDSGEGTVDFSLGYGDWIRRFRRHGFVVEDLVELRAPKGAPTTFPDFDARWARRWPAEQVWKLRRA